MKTIKNVLVVALFMLGLTAFAQQKVESGQNESFLKSPEPNKGFVGRLNLSEDQQAKLKDIRDEYRQKDSISFAEFRNKQEQRRIEELKAFKSILNKDQLDQLEKAQQNREYFEIFSDQKRPERMGRQKGPLGQNRRDGENVPCCGPLSQHELNGMNMPSCDNINQEGSERVGMQNASRNGKNFMNGQGEYFAKNGRAPQMEGVRSQAPVEHVQKQMERLRKELNLTEKQANKIDRINQKYAQEGLVEQGATKERMIAKQNEIKLVLNKDQKEKYERLLEKKALNKTKKLENGLDPQSQPMPM